jgi:beta-lactamase superfamily II metal-dependent hydrolase
MNRPEMKRLALIAAIAVVAFALVGCPSNLHPTLASDAIVSIYVFDVGEALSVFIDDDDTEIFIDAGNDRDGSVIAGKIAPYVTDGTIEYVIATHSHADHIGGMEDIYEAYQVDHTIYGDTGATKQYEEFMDAASAEPNSAVKEDEDEVIALPNGATLTVLDILDGATNTNNNSVIAVLEVGGSKMLVTGDAEDEKSKEVQAALVGRLQAESLYPIDVYVVGHHGSETSNSGVLLSLINPTFAVISSEGPSRQYGNPDITVIERLATVGATIFSTYRSGDITITFEGDGIKLSPPDSERLTLDNYREAA